MGRKATERNENVGSRDRILPLPGDCQAMVEKGFRPLYFALKPEQPAETDEDSPLRYTRRVLRACQCPL